MKTLLTRAGGLVQRIGAAEATQISAELDALTPGAITYPHPNDRGQ